MGRSGAGYNPAKQDQYAQQPPFGQIKQQADETDQHGFHYSHCESRFLPGSGLSGQG